MIKPISFLSVLTANTATRHATSAEHAAQLIADAILAGTIPPETVLRQEEIAEALSLSRMPVRDAFRLLDTRGLVELHPHRGAVVAAMDADDAGEVFEVRAAIETVALRRAIAKLTSETLDDAARLLDAMEATTDSANYFRLHRRFHLALYRTGASRRLLAQIQNYFDAAERYLRLERADVGNWAEDQDEHRAILTACRKGNTLRAVALLKPHIAESGALVASRLRKLRAQKKGSRA